MLHLVYTKNQELQNKLNSLEEVRRLLILYPIPPKSELRLRWEATTQRVYSSMILDNFIVTKKEVIQILSGSKKGKISQADKEVLSYKRAFDYIKENWTLNTKPISAKVMFVLADSKSTFKALEPTLNQVLDYLEGQNEPPLIQAAIAYSQLAILNPIDRSTNKLARFVAYLLLYKLGYDFRGLLVLEKPWQDEPVLFQNTLNSITKNGNSNRWLDFFIQGVSRQIDQIFRQIKEKQFTTDLAMSLFNLNDRQKEIMAVLDQPNLAITNKKVQKICGVSQITASRDLARLTSLGLIFPHGKGRSVNYTKV
jgi:Fic family protein